jgi:hypothetical protein
MGERNPPARGLAAPPTRARARGAGLDRPLTVAIVLAVRRAGGTPEDRQDLIAAWQRLADDRRGRAARLRYDAAHPRCRCVDRPELIARRCGRCNGLRAGGER